MELEKNAFEQAAADYSRKKENCDKIRCELSLTFTYAGLSLAQNQG